MHKYTHPNNSNLISLEKDDKAKVNINIYVIIRLVKWFSSFKTFFF